MKKKNKMTEAQFKELVETAKTAINNGMKLNEALNKVDCIAYHYGHNLNRKKMRAILEGVA